MVQIRGHSVASVDFRSLYPRLLQTAQSGDLTDSCDLTLTTVLSVIRGRD